MANYYAPNFSGLLPLFDGKSVAGGKLYAYRAGTSIPAPLFNEDGVELGSWVSIDSNGCADFLLDSSLSYKLVAKNAFGATVGEWNNVKATNAEGMDNPMENAGDLIVGGTGGTAQALPVGTEGQVLKVVSGAPAWGTDTAGMSNPMTTEGDLIVGTTDGEPARLGVGTAGQVLTSDGTTWAPAAIPTQSGDHKTAVDGSDTSPDYLAAKLAAGSGISLTNTGSAVSIAADAQPGDHHVVVTNADASAGALADKLVPGSNVTLTPVTDGDGVQTLEISATGGGGGGSLQTMQTSLPQEMCETTHVFTNQTVIVRLIPTVDFEPTAVRFMQVSAVDATKKIRARLYYPIVGEGNKVIYDSGELTIGDVYGDSTGSILPLNKITTYANVPVLYAGSRYYIGLWTSLTNAYRCHTNNYNQYNSFYSTSYIGDLDTAPLTTFNAYYPSIDVFGNVHFS
jgi:hypothetical protein